MINGVLLPHNVVRLLECQSQVYKNWFLALMMTAYKREGMKGNYVSLKLSTIVFKLFYSIGLV